MNRVWFICVISVLCIHIKAQKNEWIEYPYSEIHVRCGKNELPFDGYPMCYFIQTRYEFDNLCRVRAFAANILKRDSEINFFKEMVLGVRFQMHYNDYYFQVMYDENSNNIHFLVHYLSISWSGKKKKDALKWFAVPKPMGNYQVHFHFASKDLPVPEAMPRPPIPMPSPLIQIPSPPVPPERPSGPPNNRNGGPAPSLPSLPSPPDPKPIQGPITTIIFVSD